MEYKELATLYHMDSSAERESNVRIRLLERRESSSTFELNYQTNCGDLFIAVPRELSTLTESILLKEREVSRLMSMIPGIAGDEVLRGLVFDEVINSNAIENIHSTRRQIEEALRAAPKKEAKEKRFREFAHLYLDMTFQTPEIPKTPADIRSIYDRVMSGEPLDDTPDGELFRAGEVYVSDGLRAVHAGLHPEKLIKEAMKAMLSITSRVDMPSLYGALAAHYIFEYAHPFYDGNGRTGRYLLSLFLGESLSKPTALSLSRVLAENKATYYRAFKTVEDPLNGGELTFFVYAMMELIVQAQNDLIVRLKEGCVRYEQIREACERLEGEDRFSSKEMALIFGLAQQAAFGMFNDASVERMANLLDVKSQQSRKYLGRLADRGIVEKTRGRNPVMFALTDDFKQKEFPFLMSDGGATGE
ncbi:Fic family protein [Adlercreutzia sp. ZJ138]|uniref:Fic family protein n=1 Tax=Adlercreutzia sp. ZJ138 TaxID=2709405 RepID=UPI0013E9EE77|nr:Fic family protein [Adlercreutzia sp. ZJ138]